MGKTTLLRQFSAGRRTLYFKPLETTDAENFLALKKEAIRILGPLEKLKAAKGSLNCSARSQSSKETVPALYY